MWRTLIETVQQDAPAVFLYAPEIVVGIDRRFEDVSILPYSYWASIWRWTVAGRAAANVSFRQ